MAKLIPVEEPEDEESLEMDWTDITSEVDRVGVDFDQLLINVLTFLIGLGAPLNQWLKSNDISLLVQRKPYFCYQIYSWLLLTICLVLNIWSVIDLCLWSNKDLLDLIGQIVGLMWCLSAVTALVSSYLDRQSDIMANTYLDIDHILKDISESVRQEAVSKLKTNGLTLSEGEPLKSYTDSVLYFEQFLQLVINICRKAFQLVDNRFHLNSNSKLLVKLVFLPIVFNLFFYSILIMNYSDLSIEKVLNLFTYLNKSIVLLIISVYLTFCLIFRNKIRLFNQYLSSLIEKAIISQNQLSIISERYKYIYSIVEQFNKTFKYIIIAFYSSICLQMFYSIFAVISIAENHFDDQFVHKILDLGLIGFNIVFLATIFYFANECTKDVHKESKTTKELIEKYATHPQCDEIDMKFSVNYQRHNTAVFSKPIKIREFGLKFITKTSVVMAITTIAVRYIPDVFHYLQQKFPNNRKNVTKQAVNKTH